MSDYREDISDTLKDMQHETNFENRVKISYSNRLKLIKNAVEKVQNGNYEGLDFNQS